MSVNLVKSGSVDAALSPAPVTVILHPWQVEWAAYAGEQRTVRNNGKVVNTPDYDENPDTLQTDIEANTASCLGELATSVYTNKRWNGPYWSPTHHKKASSLPDIGQNIEVRRTRHLGSGIPVFEKEAEQKIQLVQAYVAPAELQKVLEWAATGPDSFEYICVLLTGTVPAETAWNRGWQKYPKKRVCSPKYFVSVKTLCE